MASDNAKKTLRGEEMAMLEALKTQPATAPQVGARRGEYLQSVGLIPTPKWSPPPSASESNEKSKQAASIVQASGREELDQKFRAPGGVLLGKKRPRFTACPAHRQPVSPSFRWTSRAYHARLR